MEKKNKIRRFTPSVSPVLKCKHSPDVGASHRPEQPPCTALFCLPGQETALMLHLSGNSCTCPPPRHSHRFALPASPGDESNALTMSSSHGSQQYLPTVTTQPRSCGLCWPICSLCEAPEWLWVECRSFSPHCACIWLANCCYLIDAALCALQSMVTYFRMGEPPLPTWYMGGPTSGDTQEIHRLQTETGSVYFPHWCHYSSSSIKEINEALTSNEY